MLLVDDNKVIAIKGFENNAQSFFLKLSNVPYIRVINKSAPKKESFDNFLLGTKIEIPSFVDGKNFRKIDIELGYYDTQNFKLQPSAIKIGHITIENIDYWEYDNLDGEKAYCYEFHLKGEDEGTFDYEHDGSIKVFFESVLPKINERLKLGVNFSDVNMHFFKECLLNWDWDIHHRYFSPYDSILDMVYNCKLKKIEKKHSYWWTECGIAIELESSFMFNPYVFWLLSSTISEIKFVTKGKRRYYTGVVKSLPKYIEEELELGDSIHIDYRNHVELRILASIILNYNEEYCKHGWENLSPIWESTELVIPKIDSNLYSHYCVFKGLKHFSYVDGQTRVGKDDVEWDEDTYAIPVIKGFKISNDILFAISEKLLLNFTYQEDNMRYYCYVKGESDYIPGLAQRRGGEACNKTLVSQILKLMLTMNA